MMIFDLESGALDRLMPMHLALNEAGLVLSAGPTLSKIFTGAALVGQEFFNLFEIRRPGGTTGMDDLRR
ncbi:MAG: GGDEF domain-containing protein, partial [Paracoccaceae bacterium]|nr:GGDEF domain-containing protein [Paracoccaceae bacterium]